MNENELYETKWQKLKTHFSSKPVITAIIVFVGYFFISNVLIPYILSPIISNIVCSSYGIDMETLSNVFRLFNGDTSIMPALYRECYFRISSLHQVFSYAFLFAAAFIPLKNDIFTDFRDARVNTNKLANQILACFIIMYVVNFLSNILTQSIGNALNLDTTSQNQVSVDSILTSGTLNYILCFPIIVLVGPIVEEIIFRKCIFKIVKNGWASIIISAVFFGLLHTISYDYSSFGHAVVVAIPYMASGFFFAAVYKECGYNLTVPIVIHVLNNLIAVLLTSVIPKEALSDFVPLLFGVFAR